MPKGKAKPLVDVFKETVPEMCDNILKEIKLDSGGTPGSVPASIVNFVTLLQSKTPAEAALLLLQRENARMVGLRKAMMKRTIAIKCKINGVLFPAYRTILVEKQRETSKGRDKKAVRRALCNR